MTVEKENSTDVILIGGGIMSATLGILLKELDPDISIRVFESLPLLAAESSDAWNNAGTGHSAFCELNYTPELQDGSIDTSKAVKIAEAFEISKQLWAYLIQKEMMQMPQSFIHKIPHISFVWGEENVRFLWKRYVSLQACHLFKNMIYSEHAEDLREWMPLVMEGRNPHDKFAATCVDTGTDVNFGSLTRTMFRYLQSLEGV